MQNNSFFVEWQLWQECSGRLQQWPGVILSIINSTRNPDRTTCPRHMWVDTTQRHSAYTQLCTVRTYTMRCNFIPCHACIPNLKIIQPKQEARHTFHKRQDFNCFRERPRFEFKEPIQNSFQIFICSLRTRIFLNSEAYICSSLDVSSVL